MWWVAVLLLLLLSVADAVELMGDAVLLLSVAEAVEETGAEAVLLNASAVLLSAEAVLLDAGRGHCSLTWLITQPELYSCARVGYCRRAQDPLNAYAPPQQSVWHMIGTM